MELRLIGAGLGRTGTNSLKVAVERLTGGRCYHMSELIERTADTSVWTAAVIDRQMPDWASFLSDYTATLDWPACAFWAELAEAFPTAPVLLSMRQSGEAWWASMEKTIVRAQEQVPDTPEWAARRAMVKPMLLQFCPEWPDRDAVIAAYERHNDEVRRGVAPERLVEWTTGDGWQPICDALGVPVPAEPFPHTNTSDDFRRALEIEEEQSR
jgi:hypothetical protein